MHTTYNMPIFALCMVLI